MFSFGFYNSLNGDRKYDAVQMSSIFDGVIEDGVYSNVGELFAVAPGTGLSVIVKTGRAWFDHTWNLNDSHMPLEIEEPDPLQDRIDAVVIEVDSRVESRINKIKIVKGKPSVNPEKPNLIKDGSVFQHALAYITVRKLTDSILASDIEIVVGKNETPFVQCPLKTVSIEDLFNQWDEEFTTWFDNIKLQMTDNVVTNLQRQIDEKVAIKDKATDTDINNQNPNKWISADKLEPLQDKIGDLITTYRDLEVETNGEYLKLDGRVVSKETFESYPEFLRNQMQSSLVCNKKYDPNIVTRNSGDYGPICCENMSYGNYDYILNQNRHLLKVSRIDGSISAELAVGAGCSCFAIYDGLIYIGNKNGTLYIYNTNDLSAIRNKACAIGPLIYLFKLDNRIFVISSNNTMCYSTTEFQTIVTCSFDITPKASGIDYKYSNRLFIPFGKSGSIVVKYFSNRLVFFPLSKDCAGFLYVSDDLGTTWVQKTKPDSTSARCVYYGYENEIYAICYGDNTPIKIYKASPLDLEFIETGEVEDVIATHGYDLYFSASFDDPVVFGACYVTSRDGYSLRNYYGYFSLDLKTAYFRKGFNYPYDVGRLVSELPYVSEDPPNSSASWAIIWAYRHIRYANDFVYFPIYSVKRNTTSVSGYANGYGESFIIHYTSEDDGSLYEEASSYNRYSETILGAANKNPINDLIPVGILCMKDPTHKLTIRGLPKSFFFAGGWMTSSGNNFYNYSHGYLAWPLQDKNILISSQKVNNNLPLTEESVEIDLNVRKIPLKRDTYVKVK